MERFVRGDESRTSEGHGLGLAIASSNLCVNATHVFGRGLLLTDFVAAVLARAVAPEPNRLYDQWFPLRLPRYQ